MISISSSKESFSACQSMRWATRRDHERPAAANRAHPAKAKTGSFSQMSTTALCGSSVGAEDVGDEDALGGAAAERGAARRGNERRAMALLTGWVTPM